MDYGHSHHDPPHAQHGDGHTHGVVDPAIVSTDRGVWTVTWGRPGGHPVRFPHSSEILVSIPTSIPGHQGDFSAARSSRIGK
jgi:hypothetical protein